MTSVSIDKLDQLPLLILYAINATENKSVNKIHLQKIMFQTMKVLKVDPKEVGYRPHRHGPFSEDINEEKNKLESIGYLEEKNDIVTIPDSVVSEASTIKPPSEEIGYKIKTMAEYLSTLENNELLLMIYSDDLSNNNGEYLENSDIIDEILGKRILIAIKMYRSKKISLERASELAGMSIMDFENELIKRYGVAYVN